VHQNKASKYFINKAKSLFLLAVIKASLSHLTEQGKVLTYAIQPIFAFLGIQL
tara:strand:- start:167 stop:325 length:159 start_codon:yes stop_codon:yes gene_type:complete